MQTPQSDEQKPSAHPNYVGIFIILAVLTAAEIGVTYLPIPRVPILVPMAILKAALVVMFYMHLRFDRRVFTTLFIFGLILGLVMLLSFVIMFAPPLLDIK